MEPYDRTKGQLGRVLALLDGTRTAADIAEILAVRPEYVRATVARQGWQDRLKPGRPGAQGKAGASVVRAADDGPDRAVDERELGWLAARVSGEALRDIARRDRTGASWVQDRTAAIRNADLAESGEPALEVGRAYAWPVPSMPSPGGRK